jgi:hypothetical protein
MPRQPAKSPSYSLLKPLFLAPPAVLPTVVAEADDAFVFSDDETAFLALEAFELETRRFFPGEAPSLAREGGGEAEFEIPEGCRGSWCTSFSGPGVGSFSSEAVATVAALREDGGRELVLFMDGAEREPKAAGRCRAWIEVMSRAWRE